MLRNRFRWVLIFWMFVISAVAYLDRVNIAIAGRSIQSEFHLDNIRLGWVFSAFVAGYALFQAPGGRLADRFGPRLILSIATVWWAVFTVVVTFVPPGIPGTLMILLVARLMLGIGEAMVFPASNRLVASWIPSGERGIANGWIFAGVGAGAGITPPLITYVLVHYGWRWSFWVCAGIGVIAGLTWYLLARDTPAAHPWVRAEEAEHIRRGLPAAQTAGVAIPWRTLLRSRDLAALTLSYFCFGYVAYIFFSWFFIYLNTVRGLDLKSSSYYGMLPFIAMAVFSPIGGFISDRLTRRYGKRVGRCGIACVSMALAGVFIMMGMQAADARLASLVLAGGAGALYLSTSSFWSVTADLAGQSAGSASGVMNTGNQIGGALTASLTPVVASVFGWPASFLVAAALCVVGALAWLGVDPARELSAEKALEPAVAARN